MDARTATAAFEVGDTVLEYRCDRDCLLPSTLSLSTLVWIIPCAPIVGGGVMDERHLQARFEKLDWKQQLGNLASTLARVSSRASLPEHDRLVIDLLREAALFIEWAATRVPPAFLLELATMQKEILAWKRVWPLEAARPLLTLHARNRSDRLLEMAELMGPSLH